MDAVFIPPQRARRQRLTAVGLAGHIELAREEERASIARDLHDELGSLLVRLKIELAFLAGELPRDLPQLCEKAVVIEKLLDQAFSTVQRVVDQLRPGILKEFGLAEAIRCQANEFAQASGVTCRAQCDDSCRPDDDTALALFRIVQEALTNILKHARATEVDVRLTQVHGSILLDIIDDGCGITVAGLQKPKSFGLRGIRERILTLQGEFDIEAAPAGGTRLRVVLPVQRRAALSTAPTTVVQGSLF